MKYTVTILFKGNPQPIILNEVEEFTVRYEGDTITNLQWKLAPGQNMLYIDLSQIAFVFAVEDK
ncbi:hypothetical protein [Xanthomonas phage X1]|nr:hypothetical protein [Xanthomonas phage X1]